MNGTILEELAASADGAPTADAIDRCLRTPALLHTVSECLRSGVPHARLAAARLLTAVAEQRPDLGVDFVKDLVETSRLPTAKLAKIGLEGLAAVVRADAAPVYAEREALFERARAGGALGLGALKVLAALCAQGPNYRGKLLPAATRLVQGAPAAELPKWVAALIPACAGSDEGIKRLQRELEPRLVELDEGARAKLARLLLKASRVAPTRGPRGRGASR